MKFRQAKKIVTNASKEDYYRFEKDVLEKAFRTYHRHSKKNKVR